MEKNSAPSHGRWSAGAAWSEAQSVTFQGLLVNAQACLVAHLRGTSVRSSQCGGSSRKTDKEWERPRVCFKARMTQTAGDPRERREGIEAMAAKKRAKKTAKKAKKAKKARKK